MDEIQEIRLGFFDKYGVEVRKEDAQTIRLSFYFDYAKDNHHIQFPVWARKVDIIHGLRSLIGLIAESTGGE